MMKRITKTVGVTFLAFALGCGVAPPQPLPEGHPADPGAPETPFADKEEGLTLDPRAGSERNQHVAAGSQDEKYPLDVCLVSGKKLGSMGKPYVFSVEGRQIRLCCPGCEGQVRESLATYFKKLDKASGRPDGKSAPAPDPLKKENP